MDKSQADARLTQISDALKARFAGFLDATEKSLRDSWPDIKDSSEQMTTRLGARWVTGNKAALLEALMQRVNSALSGRAPAKAMDLSALSLVDDASLSVSMAQGMVARLVQEQAAQEVRAFEGQLAQLKQAGVAVDPKALLPGALAEHFQAVLTDMKVAEDIKGLLVEKFSQGGVGVLADFYRQAIRL